MPVSLVCVTCGKNFDVPLWRKDKAKACSNACAKAVRGASRSRLTTMTCLNCKKEFKVPDSHVQRRTYCSFLCRGSCPLYLSSLSEGVCGEKNGSWVGGVVSHKDGYLYERIEGHPFTANSYVLQHRIVVESVMRMLEPSHPFLVSVNGVPFLSKGIQVHHRDGNKRNNEIRNLVACTDRAHKRMHHGKEPDPLQWWAPAEYRDLPFLTR